MKGFEDMLSMSALMDKPPDIQLTGEGESGITGPSQSHVATPPPVVVDSDDSDFELPPVAVR